MNNVNNWDIINKIYYKVLWSLFLTKYYECYFDDSFKITFKCLDVKKLDDFYTVKLKNVVDESYAKIDTFEILEHHQFLKEVKNKTNKSLKQISLEKNSSSF